jgi:hypothetical protein
MRGAAVIGLRRPPCGNDREAHGPHLFARWSSDTSEGGSCGGWTPMEAGVNTLAAAVLAAIAANQYSHPWREDIPALQLELSPAASAARQCLDITDLPLGAVLDSMFGVPVVPSADLPPGGWRITEVRPVLAEGTVTMDSRPPLPWDDPQVMAADLRQAVRDIGAGAGPIASDALHRMQMWGPCPDCGAARDTRPRASYGVEGKPGTAGVDDQLYCPACGWPGAEGNPL